MPVQNNTFNFNRQESDPVGKGTAPAKAKIDSASTGRVPYESTSDMGFNTISRLMNDAYAQRVKPTKQDAFNAGVKESVFANLLNKLDRQSFDADPTFKATDYYKNTESANSLALNPEELDYLKEANSLGDANLRIQEITDYRERSSAIGEHPYTAMLGSVWGDAPSIALPFLSAAAKGRAVANILRAGSDIYDIGSVVYVNDRLGQSNLNAAIVAGTGAIDAAFLIRGLGKGVNKAARVKTSEEEILKDTTASKTGAQFDPDAVKVKEGSANLHDDLGVANSISGSQVMTEVKGLEDIATTVDTSTIQALSKSEKHSINNLADTSMLKTSEGVPVKNVMGHLLKNKGALNEADSSFLGEFWESLTNSLGDNAVLKFAQSSVIRPHIKMDTKGAMEIVLPMPTAIVGKGAKSIAEVVDSMSAKQLRDLTHEGIHAGTLGVIHAVRNGKGTVEQVAAINRLERSLDYVRKQMELQTFSKMNTGSIKYHLGSLEEFAAGLVNDPALQKAMMQMPSYVGGESILRSSIKAIMQALGFKPKNTAFSLAVDNVHDLITGTNKMAKARAVPEFISDTMAPVAKAAEDAFHGAAPEVAQQEAASAMRNVLGKAFKDNMMLHGQIANGSQEIADLLVANPLATGARTGSVADNVRRLRSLSSEKTAAIEDAIIQAVNKENGFNFFDKFFNRARFVKAADAMEADVTKYMHAAYAAERAGTEIPKAPAHIQGVVDKLVETQWARTWIKDLKKSGVLTADADILESDFYLPVSYSSDKARFGVRTGKFSRDNVRALLKASVKDTMPHLTQEMRDALVAKWERSLLSDTKSTGVAWRNYAAKGASKDIADALRGKGIPDEVIDSIMEDQALMEAIRPTIKERNLKTRNDFDHGRQWDVGNGKKMALEDIMESSVLKSMQRYNARMSGVSAFADKGYLDLSKLAKEVDEAAVNAPAGVVSRDWVNFVDDTINDLMGYGPRGSVPDALRAMGYLSNALVLKNSGIYGITDIAFGLQELGMTKVFSAMVKGGLWTDFRKVVGDSAQANRMHSLLNGAVKNDMKFRYLHKYTEDMVDMQHTSQFLSVAKNMGQGVHTVNGLRAVHAGMTNLYSGIVYDSFLELMKHPNVAIRNGELVGLSGDAAKSWKLFNRHGLSAEALVNMRKEFAANPEAMFTAGLQDSLEVTGQRIMDYLLQQSRLGETAHFASLNPLGRVVIGYNSFALGATTRVLGRMVANKEYGGLAMLLAYQLPLMLMGTYTKAALDGKAGELTTKDMIVQSLSNMGMIGIIGNAINLFNDNSPRSELAMLAYPTSIATLLNSIANGKTPDVTKIIPFAQTALPLRALINNINTGE